MPYKSMYKSELARAAGVSLKVLNRWLEPHRQTAVLQSGGQILFRT